MPNLLEDNVNSSSTREMTKTKKKKGVRAEKASEKPNAETTFKRVEFIYNARKKSNKKTSSRRVKEKKSGEARVETVEGYKTVEK